jgi:hypothetical protein
MYVLITTESFDYYDNLHEAIKQCDTTPEPAGVYKVKEYGITPIRVKSPIFSDDDASNMRIIASKHGFTIVQ